MTTPPRRKRPPPSRGRKRPKGARRGPPRKRARARRRAAPAAKAGSGVRGWLLLGLIVIGVTAGLVSLPFAFPPGPPRVVIVPSKDVRGVCNACARFDVWREQMRERLARVEAHTIDLINRRSRRGAEGDPRLDQVFRGVREELSVLKILQDSFAKAQLVCRSQNICGPRPASGIAGPLGQGSNCANAPGLTESRAEALAARFAAVAEKARLCTSRVCPSVSCDALNLTVLAVHSVHRSLTELGSARLPGEPRPEEPEEGARGGLPDTDLLQSEIGVEAAALIEAVYRLPTAVPALASQELEQDPAVRTRQVTAFAQEVADLAARADILSARIAEETHGSFSPSDPQAAGLWRVRTVSIRLKRLAALFRELAAAEAQTGPGRTERLMDQWQRAGEGASEAVLAAMRLRDGLRRPEFDRTLITNAACGAANRERARDLAAKFSVAAASLSQCGRQSACARLEDPEAGFFAYGDSGLDPLADAEAHLDASEKMMMFADGEWSVSASADPVSMTTDLSAYRVGEAMRIDIGIGGNMCLAEAGTALSLTHQDMSRPVGAVSEPVVLGLSLDREPRQSFLIEAPAEPGTYRLALLTSETRGRSEAGAFTVAVEPAPLQCEGFTGVWETDFGILHLVVRDGTARGSYRRRPESAAGLLTGTVAGNVLRGAWQSELGSGGTRLVLSSDGRSFQGSWSHVPGELGGAGPWNGRCMR